jgi:hypothetical protein
MSTPRSVYADQLAAWEAGLRTFLDRHGAPHLLPTVAAQTKAADAAGQQTRVALDTLRRITTLRAQTTTYEAMQLSALTAQVVFGLNTLELGGVVAKENARRRVLREKYPPERIARWQAACDAKAAENPRLSWARVRAIVARDLRLSPETLKKHCRNPKQK